jgi:hypothetical protein
MLKGSTNMFSSINLTNCILLLTEKKVILYLHDKTAHFRDQMKTNSECLHVFDAIKDIISLLCGTDSVPSFIVHIQLDYKKMWEMPFATKITCRVSSWFPFYLLYVKIRGFEGSLQIAIPHKHLLKNMFG